MKQAKFALTAVAIMAVVGGALAFKANSSARGKVFTNGVSQCTVPVIVSGYTTTPDQFANQSIILNASTTAKTSALCTTSAVLYQAD